MSKLQRYRVLVRASAGVGRRPGEAEGTRREDKGYLNGYPGPELRQSLRQILREPFVQVRGRVAGIVIERSWKCGRCFWETVHLVSGRRRSCAGLCTLSKPE